VRRALAGLEGVRDLTVNGEGDLVEVSYAPAETSVKALCQQVMDTVVLPAVRSWEGRLSSSSP
jgi:hypothetical protein